MFMLQDSVRYVVAGPTGWAAMAKTLREVDEDKVKDCKEDIDTLLVFVSRTVTLNIDKISHLKGNVYRQVYSRPSWLDSSSTSTKPFLQTKRIR